MTLDKPLNCAEPALRFWLDAGSGVPTYLQLVQQVEQALRLGHLGVGDQLPRVRDVVEDLAINPNTVLKAYRELEHRGLAAGRPGRGTFVEGTPPRANLAELAALRRRLLGWLRAAHASGLDADAVTALFVVTLRESYDQSAAAVPGRRTASATDREIA
jgi:GntR family transcriptional regulator